MQIELRYNRASKRLMKAAFIKGSSPEDWFSELRKWELSDKDMTCYILPENIRSVLPGGLFVIFTNEKHPATEKVRYPYACIGHSFYLPVDSDLYPEIKPQELTAGTLWDCRVYHPSIGLVGFEKNDRIDLCDFFVHPPPVAIHWEFAHKSTPRHAPLVHASIAPSVPEDLIETMQDDIGTKSLKDIPKEEKESTNWMIRLFDRIKNIVYKCILFFIQKLMSILPDTTDSGRPKKGLLNQLEDWLGTRIKHLDEKRDSELKRLLKMFENNSEEALKYAIPLDNPYIERGTPTTSSFTLSRRDTNFRIGSLGGGYRTDLWDINQYYKELRTKYQTAATQEIEAKRYKKAAYIYANLLGDFHSAANVLEQGKHYHDAAALYTKHLNAPAQAARCYEQGGLYSNAIELYKELKQYEAAADLYTKIEQPKQAYTLYEEALKVSMHTQNYIGAARLASEKLNDFELSKHILLEGWNISKQPEACLVQYFQEVISQEPEALAAQLRNVYQHHTTEHRKIKFLNVLEQLQHQYPTEEIEKISVELAYEIISEQAVSGNTTKLHFLKKFISKDPLIGADSLRYILQKKNTPAKQQTNSTVDFQLEKQVEYVEAYTHGEDILVLGYKNKIPVLIRSDWEGNFESYACGTKIEEDVRHSFIRHTYYSKHVLLYSGSSAVLPDIKLPPTSVFSKEIRVYDTHWLPRLVHGVCINAGGGVSAITIEKSIVKMHFYSIEGKLLKTQDYKLESILETTYTKSNRNLYHKKGAYYTYDANSIWRLLGDGTVSVVSIQSPIRMISLSPSETFLMAVSTDDGLIIIRQNLWEMKVVTSFFAADLQPFLIRFTPNNLMIVAEKNKIVVFEIDNNQPSIVQSIHPPVPVVDVLRSNQRNSFAVLDQEGNITRYKL
jgi:tetratricopeptide (TPR) repeat protein